jgi:transposase
MKYTKEFKQTVVHDYLSSHEGYRNVSRRHGMANRSLLERWVVAYEIHGDAGLSPKRSRYDAAFKLSVLQHMWENRLSITETAAKFDIRRHSTVGDWERAHREGGVKALTPSLPKRRPKQMTIPTTKPAVPAGEDKRSREELLAENEHLRMEVAYLKKLEALVQARQKSAAPKKRK